MTASLYHAAIKRLAEAAHGRGRLQIADGEARLDNSLCGDRVTMQVRIEHGTLASLAHEVRGCLLCRAAAAIIGLRAPGRDAAELVRIEQTLQAMLETGAPVPLEWEELGLFAPAREHLSRHACVLLPFQALCAALRACPGTVADRSSYGGFAT